MHMVSEKDLNSAELETMRMSRNPTTVMTANGLVQTREEATWMVYELAPPAPGGKQIREAERFHDQ